MNCGSCCLEQRTTDLLKHIRSYLLSLIPLMGGICISYGLPGNADAPKLVLSGVSHLKSLFSKLALDESERGE